VRVVQKALAVFVRELVAGRSVLEQIRTARFRAHDPEAFAVLVVPAKTRAIVHHSA
jgi:hypothetical protein